MTIEHNFNGTTLKKLAEKLEPFGYRRVFPHISLFDAWYVHADVPMTSFTSE
jgi:hypothetical protein